MKTRIFFLSLFITCFTFVNSQNNEAAVNEKDYFIKAHAMAANDFNDSLLQEYVKLYPKGNFVEKAQMSIDVCAWQNARFKNTKESYQFYLDEFPEGKAVKLAQKMLLSLKDSTDNNNE